MPIYFVLLITNWTSKCDFKNMSTLLFFILSLLPQIYLLGLCLPLDARRVLSYTEVQLIVQLHVMFCTTKTCNAHREKRRLWCICLTE